MGFPCAAEGNLVCVNVTSLVELGVGRICSSQRWEGSSCWQPFICQGYNLLHAKLTSPFIEKKNSILF